MNLDQLKEQYVVLLKALMEAERDCLRFIADEPITNKTIGQTQWDTPTIIEAYAKRSLAKQEFDDFRAANPVWR
jgi:hypothetical protein